MQYRYAVSAEKQLRPVYESLYKDGDKKITENFLSDLNCESVAIFWQDDGGIYEENGYFHGVLSTNFVDVKDVYIVNAWINSLTGATGTARTDNNGRFSLRYSYKELQKLLPCIEQYVIPKLAYKVCLDASVRRSASLPKLVLGDDKVARVPDLLAKFCEENDIVRPAPMVKVQN